MVEMMKAPTIQLLHLTMLVVECQVEYDKVGDMVRRYQKIVRDTGGGCVMGSGRCGTHNVKLVRAVNMRRVSDMNQGDELRWVRRESTALVCPAKERFRDDRRSEQVANNTQLGPTNKKLRLKCDEEENQSALFRENDVIPD